ncbi:restriction modification system DNA specificity domain-containing protein [Aeromonas caviae]|uniref:Restriction modification system DNA specificity domain-containing protein n=1 Tax=Aeromonas caviae TaxID=648 RepID=A0ABD0BCW0_AERCA|nr:restriction endonuclease subunit S [Aeromonas caviae]BCM75500.1 restriction modification system DNA specificity domain-containing protein [Aeromonas caviae]GJA83312.1 restriction modification system DNA specificity domain-containing protein [Aeromonas caviae]GJB13273.1 restriction modification system DNA specificity domain-containing protein [Aeromonas caviae]GJB26131.1 restriction modification system DNA specificity domain-containing protein [Aeromonas caviae]GJB34748.1 restriction modific
MTLTVMPKYDAYKDSGVEWLGEIPVDWNIKPGLVAFSENKRSNKGMKQDVVLSLSYGKIIIKPADKLVGLVPESFETYQIVAPDDIIIRCTDLQNDQTSLRTGLANDHGIITSAYLNLKVKGLYSARYLHYYLHALDTTKVIYRFGSGLRQNLSYLDFKRLPVFDISWETQAAIANFLDTKTAQIDEAIAIKEQQIALLNERKQILIQQAVIKGLNQNVPMKKSGVDWVGDIPEHWSLQPGFIVFNENKKSNKGMIESQVLSLSYGKIIVKAKEKLNGLVPESFETYQVVSPGNIIIRCTDLQNDKTSLRTGFVKNHGIITSAYLCLNISLEQNAEYIHYFLHALDVCKEIYRYGSGLRQSLSFSDFKRMLVITPPIEEQDQIVTFIREQEENIMSAVELLKAQIEKLTEYKKSLIHSAVTGNIKVV